MPRFVVLEHDHPFLHWDLMLESGEILRTWRLTAPPEADRAEIEAEATFDHRPIYLDYEGPVSGDRGHVRRWDRGQYVLLRETQGSLTLRFDGAKLRGSASLRQVGEQWVLAREGSGTEGEIGGGGARDDAGEKDAPADQPPAA